MKREKAAAAKWYIFDILLSPAKRLLLTVVFLCLFAPAAFAGCPNPSEPGGESVEGAVVYNNTYKTMQFCDGATWWGMKGGNGGLPACADGQTIVASSGSWICAAGGGGGGSDDTPNSFDFADNNPVGLSQLVLTTVVQITGLAGDVAVSISGTGTPQYRTCSNSDCSSYLQNWTNSAGTIQSGQYLQLRNTASAANSTAYMATVTVGTASDQWTIATGLCGTGYAGGACWYMGAANQSCTTACSTHGGYNAATATYAGDDSSGGTNAHCRDILDKLSDPGSTVSDTTFGGSASGCVAGRSRNNGAATTAAASSTFTSRACACNS